MFVGWLSVSGSSVPLVMCVGWLSPLPNIVRVGVENRVGMSPLSILFSVCTGLPPLSNITQVAVENRAGLPPMSIIFAVCTGLPPLPNIALVVVENCTGMLPLSIIFALLFVQGCLRWQILIDLLWKIVQGCHRCQFSLLLVQGSRHCRVVVENRARMPPLSFSLLFVQEVCRHCQFSLLFVQECHHWQTLLELLLKIVQGCRHCRLSLLFVHDHIFTVCTADYLCCLYSAAADVKHCLQSCWMKHSVGLTEQFH